MFGLWSNQTELYFVLKWLTYSLICSVLNGKCCSICSAWVFFLFLRLYKCTVYFWLIIWHIDNGFCGDLELVKVITVLFFGCNTLVVHCCTTYSYCYSLSHISSPSHPHTHTHRTTRTDHPRHTTPFLLHRTLTLNLTCHLLFGPLMAVYS